MAYTETVMQAIAQTEDIVMLKCCYFSLSSGVLNRTSSHMCGSWYLLMSLFGDGSFTLMNIASFMVLHFSFHYAVIVYISVVACNVRMFISWRRSFMVFFKSFFKCS